MRSVREKFLEQDDFWQWTIKQDMVVKLYSFNTVNGWCLEEYPTAKITIYVNSLEEKYKILEALEEDENETRISFEIQPDETFIEH